MHQLKYSTSIGITVVIWFQSLCSFLKKKRLHIRAMAQIAFNYEVSCAVPAYPSLLLPTTSARICIDGCAAKNVRGGQVPQMPSLLPGTKCLELDTYAMPA